MEKLTFILDRKAIRTPVINDHALLGKSKVKHSTWEQTFFRK